MKVGETVAYCNSEGWWGEAILYEYLPKRVKLVLTDAHGKIKYIIKRLNQIKPIDRENGVEGSSNV